MCTGYDSAIIISYPTSASGIIQLVFNFEQMRTVTIIFGDRGVMGHTMMAKPIRALELHYRMITF